MAFIDTIPASEASGEVRAMYARQQEEWGYVPDYAKAFCHRPEVMECWGRMLAAIKRPVDPVRRELATFAAAHELRHTPCTLAHGAQLAGMIGNDAVIALAEGRDNEVLSAREQAIVGFARQIARDASKVSRRQVQDLKDVHGLSDAEVFDIAAIAASRSFFTKVLDALGVDADSPMGTWDADLCEALAVGRPISEAPVEVLEPGDFA